MSIGYSRPSPPYIAEAPDTPDWLIDELRSNVEFVHEAIDNGLIGADLSEAYLADDGNAMKLVVDRALSEWIDHQVEYHEYDFMKVSRIWTRQAA